MALQTLVGKNKTIKPFNTFTEGESIEGHFIGLTDNRFNTEDGPKRTDLNFKTRDGTVICVPRNGKLNYLEDDLAEVDTTLVIGAFTKLTRTGTYKNKSGKDSPYYSIAQDPDDVIEVNAETTTATAEETAKKIEELRAKASSGGK